jgi:hypothetical protein
MVSVAHRNMNNTHSRMTADILVYRFALTSHIWSNSALQCVETLNIGQTGSPISAVPVLAQLLLPTSSEGTLSSEPVFPYVRYVRITRENVRGCDANSILRNLANAFPALRNLELSRIREGLNDSYFSHLALLTNLTALSLHAVRF